MAKTPRKPPPRQYNWRKGTSGNPSGSSAKRRISAAMARMQPALAKAAPALTLEGIKIMVAGILAGSIADVKRAQTELGDELCVGYSSLVMAIQVAAKKGDVASIFKAVEFVCGRAPEKLEVTGKDGAPLSVNKSTMSIADMEAELEAIRKRKKAQGLL